MVVKVLVVSLDNKKGFLIVVEVEVGHEGSSVLVDLLKGRASVWLRFVGDGR